MSFFKVRLYRISQLQTNADSVYFLKLTFRNSEKTTPYFISRSEGCILESTFNWVDEKPIEEADILTFELYNLRKSSIKKISTFQTLMECYSPCRIYYLSDQLENGVTFDFSLYYENFDNLLINRYDRSSLAKQLTSSTHFNCKWPLDIIDFAHCFKQPDSSKKLISYGTFNKV